jgi:hypothetical protein
MDPISLLIHFLSGVAGAHIVRAQFRSLKLGTPGNSLAGIVGGGLGGQILGSSLGTSRILARNGFDLGIVISEIASGGIGGALLALMVAALGRWPAK